MAVSSIIMTVHKGSFTQPADIRIEHLLAVE